MCWCFISSTPGFDPLFAPSFGLKAQVGMSSLNLFHPEERMHFNSFVGGAGRKDLSPVCSLDLGKLRMVRSSPVLREFLQPSGAHVVPF